jgi:hypothetical protein
MKVDMGLPYQTRKGEAMSTFILIAAILTVLGLAYYGIRNS